MMDEGKMYPNYYFCCAARGLHCGGLSNNIQLIRVCYVVSFGLYLSLHIEVILNSTISQGTIVVHIVWEYIWFDSACKQMPQSILSIYNYKI